MSDDPTSRLARIALIAAVLIAAGVVGTRVYQSQLPPAPSAEEARVPADERTMIADMESHLKAEPNDAEGWRTLGWSLFQTGKFAESATAYTRATRLAPGKADYWSSLGEALVMAGSGDVRPDARAAFAKAVEIDPKDPRARYFIGIAKDKSGDHKGAIDDWIALLKDTPPGEPWEVAVRQTVTAVGAKNKIDVADRLAAIVPAGANVSAVDQGAVIAGMVDRLAAKLKADPKNVQGWIMLMRSYVTLGRGKDAAGAYQAAVTSNPTAKAELDEAAKALGVAS